MEVKDVIGRTVFCPRTKACYVIHEVDGVHITVREDKKNGWPSYYRFETGTAPYDNAIVRGSLVFTDGSLYQPFREAYEAYRNGPGRLDQYFYWSQFGD